MCSRKQHAGTYRKSLTNANKPDQPPWTCPWGPAGPRTAWICSTLVAGRRENILHSAHSSPEGCGRVGLRVAIEMTNAEKLGFGLVRGSRSHQLAGFVCLCLGGKLSRSQFERYLNGTSVINQHSHQRRGLCREGHQPQELLHCPRLATGNRAGWSREAKGELVELVCHVKPDYLDHPCPQAHPAASGGVSRFKFESL